MLNRAKILLLALFLISVSACRNTASIQHIETSQYVFSDSSNAGIDSSAWNFIQPYRDSMNKSMNEILVISAQAMVKNNPEGLLGDFASDACSWAAEEKCKSYGINLADFTFLNSGGLRAPLPSGPVTLGNIYELMPFENELVILSLGYTETNQLLNYIAVRGGTPVSNLRMNIKNKEPYDIFIS